MRIYLMGQSEHVQNVCITLEIKNNDVGKKKVYIKDRNKCRLMIFSNSTSKITCALMKKLESL